MIAHDPPVDAGFSLMEVMVATVIAALAVVGLAYTFGMGRSFIDKFEVARAALAAAQGRLEVLSVTPRGAPDLSIGTHALPPQDYEGSLIQERWRVEYWDAPVDGLGGADPNPLDMKHVTVQVVFGRGADTSSVSLSRLFPS